MSKITTADCRAFLVSRVEEDILPATSWFFDDNSGWEELENRWLDANPDKSYKDYAVDYNDPAMIAAAEAARLDQKEEARQALSKATNWKRRSKSKDGDAIVREFMCDTSDNHFDGQVGYEVIERNGVLSLGENIGD